MIPLFVVAEVSGESNVWPKNYSNSGVDVPAGRVLGVMSTEHTKSTLSPMLIMIGAEGEMDTGPMSTAQLQTKIKLDYHYSQMLT